MKTAAWYITQMKFRAGKNTWDDRVDPWDVFNLAGADLLDAHAWSFLSVTENIPAVKDQDHIELPEDFNSLESVVVDGAGIGGAQITAPQVLRSIRQRAITPSSAHLVAIDGVATRTSPAALPRVKLSVWPIPSANASPTFMVTYRRRWKDMSQVADSDHYPNLPPQFHIALTLACRVWAWTYLNPEKPAPDAAAYSAAVEALIRLDDTQQIDFGPIVGGVSRADEDDGLVIGTMSTQQTS